MLGGKKKSLGRGGGFPVEILRQRNTIFSRGMHQNMRSDVSVLLFLQDDAVVKNNSIFVHVPLHTVLVHEARGEGEGGGGGGDVFPNNFGQICLPVFSEKS